MLCTLLVQILGACCLGALIVGFAAGHRMAPSRAGPAKVVASRDPGRWTEVVWVAGTLVSVLWPVGVLVLPEYAYHWPGFADFPGSGAVQLAGFVAALAGGLLFFGAARALGRHMTPAIQVQEGHRLVEEGPYRYVRHPVYTAIITGAGGLAALFLSPVLAGVVLVLVGLALYRARLEEQLLSSPEGFGQLYLGYVARTGRFLPRIRSGP